MGTRWKVSAVSFAELSASLTIDLRGQEIGHLELCLIAEELAEQQERMEPGQTPRSVTPAPLRPTRQEGRVPLEGI